MIKRIVDISEQAYLRLENKQLLVDKQGVTAARIAVEDLGVLILEHPAIVISQAVVIACQKNNVALVFCDAQHLPYSVALPLSDGNALHSKEIRKQIELKRTGSRQAS